MNKLLLLTLLPLSIPAMSWAEEAAAPEAISKVSDDLLHAKFGLEFGMTKAQVQALTDAMTESASSAFRNAYEVAHFPNEKINAPDMTLGKRTVYFDEDGKLWRVWAELLLKENTYFGGGEVMQAYGTIKKWLSLQNDSYKSVQPEPHVQQDISSCRDAADWEKEDPESYNMAREFAPKMAYEQRVIFDIGCGAMPPWQGGYLSRNGKERYGINIRYGNLYATPLAYSAAVGNEHEMTKKWSRQQNSIA